jgi:hypothetical protein
MDIDDRALLLRDPTALAGVGLPELEGCLRRANRSGGLKASLEGERMVVRSQVVRVGAPDT